ncbi:MAG TPA: CoA ester lyase [Thermomicrobiales bacterium]|nr:CoA ester lyase [Thermomicrobiales bacterium]
MDAPRTEAAPPERLERSVLIVPASNEAMIAKAARAAADAVCLDLEDAVAPNEKEASRANVARAFRDLDFGRKLRAFRVNGLDTPFGYRDLIDVVEAAGDRIDLVVVPKVDRPEDVYVVATLLAGIAAHQGFPDRIGIEAQIETALGCVNADAIAAASPRLEALVYGPGDFAASARMPLDTIGAFDDNDARYPGHRWHYVMQRVVVAARAHGKRAIDGPYAAIRDAEGFERTCAIGRVLGFDGRWCIHPGQLDAANRVFAPPAGQVAWARRVLDEYERALAAGRGAIAVDGKMIDAASLRVARTLVAKDRLARGE